MPVDDIYLSDDVTDELEDSSPDRVNDSYTMQATGRTKIELSRNQNGSALSNPANETGQGFMPLEMKQL